MDIKDYRRQTDEQAKAISGQFQSVLTQCNELKDAVVAYKNCITTALYGDVFEELAQLMRDVEKKDELFAKRLEKILLGFGMEEIHPHPGDVFECNFHIRENRSETGTIIAECLCRGWKLEEKRVLAAIVRTSETSEGGTKDEQ